ncbi:YbjQ family protein [Kribbella sp. NBC_01245]|uniref:YbjQ family protein n=1 Tax=Kribbella sp. NBC_01245 TaxID=2903578 RepID=UPI002E2D048F|nr:YbjQ family protein [Kribbella sp. NBC_01245]
MTQPQYPNQPYPQSSGAPYIGLPGSPYPVLVSTMDDLPGFHIERVFGEVIGLTVRSLVNGLNFSAGFRAMGGGEQPEYTQMLAETRHVAVMRMCIMAQQMGGNAVLAMRFDCNEVGEAMSEVVAYGTAVLARPIDIPNEDRLPD